MSPSLTKGFSFLSLNLSHLTVLPLNFKMVTLLRFLMLTHLEQLNIYLFAFKDLFLYSRIKFAS